MATCKECADRECEHDWCEHCDKCVLCGAPAAPAPAPQWNGTAIPNWIRKPDMIPPPFSPHEYERFVFTQSAQLH